MSVSTWDTTTGCYKIVPCLLSSHYALYIAGHSHRPEFIYICNEAKVSQYMNCVFVLIGAWWFLSPGDSQVHREALQCRS